MPRAKPRVLVVAFAELPATLLDAYGVPRTLAPRGFFCRLREHRSTVFERHPERGKLAAKSVDAAMALVDELIRACRWSLTDALGVDHVDTVSLSGGFHVDLDAAALAQAYAADGFRVVGIDALGACPAAGVLGRIESATRVWPLARALVADAAAIGPVLAALAGRDDLRRAPAGALDELGARIARADTAAYRALLEKLGEDLVARALPVIERLCGAKRGNRRVTGLPADLATLLSAFDGVPALGVMTAAEVRRETAWHRDRKAAGGQPRWDERDDRVRGDRHWQSAWTPFWTNGGGDYLCIDDSPTARGRAGQVIGVWHDPPGLHHAASSLGAWLWEQLAVKEVAPAASPNRPRRKHTR